MIDKIYFGLSYKRTKQFFPCFCSKMDGTCTCTLFGCDWIMYFFPERINVLVLAKEEGFMLFASNFVYQNKIEYFWWIGTEGIKRASDVLSFRCQKII